MNFTVYSKRGCPYCTKVINVLNYKEFGEGSTFPQVVHEQKPIGGCADTVRYLQEKSLL
jgi:glutaredoxin